MAVHAHDEIHVFTEHIGTKSFTMAYELMVGSEVRTTGRSVLVCFDAISNVSVEVSAPLRNALEKLKR